MRSNENGFKLTESQKTRAPSPAAPPETFNKVRIRWHQERTSHNGRKIQRRRVASSSAQFYEAVYERAREREIGLGLTIPRDG